MKSFKSMFILFLCIINAYLLVDKFVSLKIKNDELKLSNIYRERLLYQIKYANSFKIHFFPTIKDINNNSFNPDSLLNLNTKLFFRITENNCSPCVEQEIKNLKLFKGKIQDSNIVILASYKGVNDLKILKERYDLDYRILNMPFSAFDYNPVESQNFPYFFTITRQKEANSIFVPDKSLPQLTIDYLNYFRKQIRPK